jgi:hypothetical protein
MGMHQWRDVMWCDVELAPCSVILLWNTTREVCIIKCVVKLTYMDVNLIFIPILVVNLVPLTPSGTVCIVSNFY